jgi:hypothetical protein
MLRIHVSLLAAMLLGAVCVAGAQPHLQDTAAFAALDRKDYPECARRFKEAVDAGSKSALDAYGAAACLAQVGMKDEAFSYLDRAFELYFGQPEAYEGDPALGPLRSDPRWPVFIAKVKAREAKVDPALRAELLRMRDEDQAPRREDPRLQDPEAAKRAADANAKHVARLREIVRERGWPGRGVAGVDGASAAWLVVQHSDLTFQKEVLPLLQAAAKTGEASPVDVALLTDRVLVREGKKQIYGTQGEFLEDGTVGLAPIEDEANVDARRKEVGLGPIAEYLRDLQEMYRKRP